MLLSCLRGLAVLWLTHRFVLSLNPCMIDRDACVPIEDFEVNCTCILTAKEPINATDDVYMFFMGHQFPLYLFRQIKMPQIFRKKLDVRIPSEQDFQASFDLPDTIYKNLRFEENMALFMANSSASAAILHHLINESYIRTPDLRENSDKWCAEGECAAFVHREAPFNKSSGIYAHMADLLHIIEMRGRSIFAVSSVFAEFDLPKVHSLLCGYKCAKFYWNEGVLCRQKCAQK
ncbi:unnamed protein product [Cylicocyclus nassatus]|uniref:Uncharacterized protein n=1 Tax=Cylicocyclus nassatus TaxID=53992 RepID=A0AA36M3R8_CYLNA|nr:unnamed protein product [Cylicocyclus nassatus]